MMKDTDSDTQVVAGPYVRQNAEGLDPAYRVAVAVGALWLLAALVFWAATGFGSGLTTAVVVAVVMPLGLIWVAAQSARTARIVRDENRKTRAAIESLRETRNGATAAPAPFPVYAKAPAAPQPQPEPATQPAPTAAPTSFHTTRVVSRPQPATETRQADAPRREEAQPGLGLEPAGGIADPVGRDDFITALNFPESADDRAGFNALRRALADPRAARLVQASQDVLTLLSQDGIYMDDLTPDRARPEIWRRFAEGERGRAVAALGGIRDRSSLALAAQRMRKDQVFRDAAHHLLRTFDRSFATFAQDASDAEIIRLAETRTARAFMLLGRVAGLFD